MGNTLQGGPLLVLNGVVTLLITGRGPPCIYCIYLLIEYCNLMI